MAGPNQALDDSEQDDFGIPGQDDSGSSPTGQPDASTGISKAGSLTPGGNSPTMVPGDTSGPKVSGRALFLGNLLKTLVTGIQNAPGNPNNAFDRGFMSNSPQAQQQRQLRTQTEKADLSKAQSEADLMRMNVSLTRMKALQAEYLLKRLPQEQQMATLQKVSAFKEFLIKSGANVEAEGDDEKAADAQAAHLSANDPRAKQHEGTFYSLPTMDSSGKAKFDVVYVPSKDVLQQDFKYTDADGNDQTLSAGTPMFGAMGKLVDSIHGQLSNETKSQHKMLSDALKPNVPDGEINQTVEWLKNQQKQNTPLYQQNKNAVDAQINTLSAAQRTTQNQKLEQARAGAEMHQEIKDADKAKGATDALNYADSYIKSGQYTGPGDEALMEKFFELAKPSSGFRMSQPQIDMLKNARSWMDSAEAKTRHATEGTWFSGTQRKQIADTMRMLGNAKGANAGPSAIYASAPGKPRMVSHDGGKTWQTVQ